MQTACLFLLGLPLLIVLGLLSFLGISEEAVFPSEPALEFSTPAFEGQPQIATVEQFFPTLNPAQMTSTAMLEAATLTALPPSTPTPLSTPSN